MHKWREIALVAVVALLLSVHSSHSPACGPYFVRAVFSFDAFPQLEAPQLAAGELGVLRPKYFRRFLFVAYRYLTDEPLTPAEQETFLNGPGHGPRARDPWADALKEVAEEDSPRFSVFRKVPDSDWQSFLNCPPDAFRNAATTLRERSEQFGADHEGVRDWIAAQRAVFSNCSEGQHIPTAAASDLPEALRKDRDYQIAAAYFYALELREAEERFRMIAGDTASPWYTIAPYLAARCLIRRATLDPRPGLVDKDMLSRAASELRALLEDESRAAAHPAARNMVHYLDGRLMPGRRLAEVSAALAKPAIDRERFWQNLSDFQTLFDKNAAREDGALESELVAWVVNFQDTSDTARDEAVRRWRETRSVPWLLAALSKVQAGHGAVPALLESAAELAADSPAWATATFHRVRLLLEAGETGEARSVLDRALPEVSPASASNLLRAQRFGLARDAEEFVQFAERRVVGYGSDFPGGFGPPAEDAPQRQLDADGVAVFNRGLPLATLSELAAADNLSPPTRREAAIAGFVRALLLEDYETAGALATSAGVRFDPGSESPAFDAALLLLRTPGLRPYLVSGRYVRENVGELDNFRDNWWCAFDIHPELGGWPYARSSWGWADNKAGPPQPQVPDFLSDSQRARFQSEWDRLLALPTAPNLLADIVVRHAREHPDDPDVPEALHLAVRTTRYGCKDKSTTGFSKAAFQLLHRRYPNSEWTKKTPHHY